MNDSPRSNIETLAYSLDDEAILNSVVEGFEPARSSIEHDLTGLQGRVVRLEVTMSVLTQLYQALTECVDDMRKRAT